jgi:hypothetical protein
MPDAWAAQHLDIYLHPFDCFPLHEHGEYDYYAESE